MKDNILNRAIHGSVLEALNDKDKSINPVIAIISAILIALVISAINLVLFIRSDMYEKVRLIQNPEQVLVNDTLLDVSSPLTTDALSDIKTKIDDQLKLLDDNSDYPAGEIAEESLGI